jgi:hypothetical protein
MIRRRVLGLIRQPKSIPSTEISVVECESDVVVITGRHCQYDRIRGRLEQLDQDLNQLEPETQRNRREMKKREK